MVVSIPEHFAQVPMYIAGKDAPGAKLASNELIGMSHHPEVQVAMLRALSDTHIYIPGSNPMVPEAIAKYVGLDPEQIIIDNGSDVLISHISRILLQPGDNIITSQGTFPGYTIAAKIQNAQTQAVPYQNNMYDLHTIKERINDKTKIIFLANPDNPTGTYIDQQTLSSFIQEVPKDIIIVLDEAYYEFAQGETNFPDSIALAKEYENVFVTRTFSKGYGLAGVRIGYGMSTSPELIEVMKKVRLPFTVNRVAQVAAEKVLEYSDYYQRHINQVLANKQLCYNFLNNLDVDYVKSATNFIFIDTKRDGVAIEKVLEEKGFSIRNMSGGGWPGYIRVTIPVNSEINQQRLDAFQNIIEKTPSIEEKENMR